LTFHKVLISRRVLEREKSDKKDKIHLKCRNFPFP